MILVFLILESMAGHLFSTKSHKNSLQQQSKNMDSNKKLPEYQGIVDKYDNRVESV